MYVVVIGGGNVGYYLTRELLHAGHEVVMIEKDASRARQIADELGSIVVPNDGCGADTRNRPAWAGPT